MEKTVIGLAPLTVALNELYDDSYGFCNIMMIVNGREK